MTTLTSIVERFAAGESFLADVDDADELDEAMLDYADAELERGKEASRECRCPIPLDRSVDAMQHDELCLRWQGGDR